MQWISLPFLTFSYPGQCLPPSSHLFFHLCYIYINGSERQNKVSRLDFCWKEAHAYIFLRSSNLAPGPSSPQLWQPLFLPLSYSFSSLCSRPIYESWQKRREQKSVGLLTCSFISLYTFLSFFLSINYLHVYYHIWYPGYTVVQADTLICVLCLYEDQFLVDSIASKNERSAAGFNCSIDAGTLSWKNLDRSTIFHACKNRNFHNPITYRKVYLKPLSKTRRQLRICAGTGGAVCKGASSSVEQ